MRGRSAAGAADLTHRRRRRTIESGAVAVCGPSRRTRERSYYRTETYTTTSTAARYRAVMAQQGDPGYQATSVLPGESALALVDDRDLLSDRHGVLTPAAAIGDALLVRLPAAGVRLEVSRLS